MRKSIVELIEKIKPLLKKGLTNKEIAKELNVSKNSVANLVERYLGGNRNYIKRIAKHKHLRKPVMLYFLNHTAKETCEFFNLKESEFKSLTTVCYKLDEFKKIRKDKKRVFRKWNASELKFMIQSIGLIPREEIGNKLGRGKWRVIKEKLQKLGISVKTIHGMTLSVYRKTFNQEPSLFIQTRTGPTSENNKSYYKIIPWFVLKEEIDTGFINCHDVMKTYIEAMYLFQEWIYEGNVLNKMTELLESN